MFPNQRKPVNSTAGLPKVPSQLMGFTRPARTPAAIGLTKDPDAPGLPANAPPPPAVNLNPPIGHIRNPIRTAGIRPPRSAVPPRV